MSKKEVVLFEMFAGYGGASWALKKAGIDYRCIGISEIDKGAIICFNNNFKGIKNYGDCKNIDPKELPDFNLLTAGFPCQDVSIAGKRDLNKGRTNLYTEILRIAKHKKPKYLVLENVKGLLSMEVDDRKLHLKIVSDLNKIGYDVCYKVLNSKDYGIPQNRERIFFICKYGSWDFMEFMFPEKKELKIFLKDILEKEIDKKYYLNERQLKRIKRIDKQIGHCLTTGDNNKLSKNMNCIDERSYKGNRVIERDKPYFSTLTTDSNDYICHSLYPRSSMSGKGGTGPLSKQDGTSYTLDTGNCQAIEHNKNIRRLTPRECFRLMGFLDDEINLKGLSDNRIYKLAGNGWDINLVSLIFKRLFK